MHREEIKLSGSTWKADLAKQAKPDETFWEVTYSLVGKIPPGGSLPVKHGVRTTINGRING